MKYTFVSLGRLESIGIRLGGAGLGNILFPWATAIVYAKTHNLTRLQTTWKSLKIGTFLRKERDKRMYFDLFTGKDGVGGLKKFLLLNFTNKVKCFSSMDVLFEPFKHEHNFVKTELLKIINPLYIEKASNFNTQSVALHIRMGDFQEPETEQILREGAWSYRLPIKWYISIIEKIRLISDLPIYIFSDATDKELQAVLVINNCKRVYFGSAISDLIALSRCKALVSSASTFSMWASFLGQMPTIWFPGQMQQKLISSPDIFEGEIDYTDKLPTTLINMLSND